MLSSHHFTPAHTVFSWASASTTVPSGEPPAWIPGTTAEAALMLQPLKSEWVRLLRQSLNSLLTCAKENPDPFSNLSGTHPHNPADIQSLSLFPNFCLSNSLKTPHQTLNSRAQREGRTPFPQPTAPRQTPSELLGIPGSLPTPTTVDRMPAAWYQGVRGSRGLWGSVFLSA